MEQWGLEGLGLRCRLWGSPMAYDVRRGGPSGGDQPDDDGELGVTSEAAMASPSGRWEKLDGQR